MISKQVSWISTRGNSFEFDMRPLGLLVSVVAAFGLVGELGAQAPQTTLPRWIPDPESQLLPAPVPATVKDGFRLVTLGDLLYWRPVRSQIDSAMEGALRLVRDADFATANHEGTFFDLRTKRIAPRESSVLMAGPSELAADIKNLGVRF